MIRADPLTFKDESRSQEYDDKARRHPSTVSIVTSEVSWTMNWGVELRDRIAGIAVHPASLGSLECVGTVGCELMRFRDVSAWCAFECKLALTRIVSKIIDRCTM